LFETANDVCGSAIGSSRYSNALQWNDGVAKVIKKQRTLYKIWYRTNCKRGQLAYDVVRKRTNKTMFLEEDTEQKK
jgi:hypothetical protein